MRRKLRVVLMAVLVAAFFSAIPADFVSADETLYSTGTKDGVGAPVSFYHDGKSHNYNKESWMLAEGETAYCVQIADNFQPSVKKRENAASKYGGDTLSEIALRLEYVDKEVKDLDSNQKYYMKQSIVWNTLEECGAGQGASDIHVGYDYIFKDTQEKVYAAAKTFAKENKDLYLCYGYVYSDGISKSQDVARFWAEKKEIKIKKESTLPEVTDGNSYYSLDNAEYSIYKNADCNEENQVAIISTGNKEENGDDYVEGESLPMEIPGKVFYIKEVTPPQGFELNDEVIEVKAAELNEKVNIIHVSDEPVLADPALSFNKQDASTGTTAQGEASLENTQFIWKYYAGNYPNASSLNGVEPTRTWVTKTTVDKDGDSIRYSTRLDAAHIVSSSVEGDDPLMKDGKIYLPMGTITVEEKTAPEGYNNDPVMYKGNQVLGSKYIANIGENGIEDIYGTDDSEADANTLAQSEEPVNTQITVTDTVIKGGVAVKKTDKDTGSNAQGGATLMGTEFSIYAKDASTGQFSEEAVNKIVTGADGTASTDINELPYGEYLIKETAAPTGYLLGNDEGKTFSITEDNKIVSVSNENNGSDLAFANQVILGNVEGTKVIEGTDTPLANVTFEIQGVSDPNFKMEVVADTKGHFTTAKAGETGALPYGSYKLVEKECDANAGMKLIKPIEFAISAEDNGKTLNLGTINNDYKVDLHTTATDKEDGDKQLTADNEATISDKVLLTGLTPGTEYELRGWQVDKETGEILTVGGTPVEVTKKFTADSENMEITLDFTFNANDLAGKTLVTYEVLYDITNPQNPVLVGSHQEIDNQDQTVKFVEPKPEGGTDDNAQTGDNTRLPLLIGMCLATLLVAILTLTLGRRRYEK